MPETRSDEERNMIIEKVNHLYETSDLTIKEACSEFGISDSTYYIWKKHRDLEPELLYDISSTYFEGQKAEGGEYGYSRNHLQDRCQIIIGPVCDEIRKTTFIPRQKIISGQEL